MAAYDLKVLGSKLKKPLMKGLEAFLDEGYLELKVWFKESATASENKIDDVVAGFADSADSYVQTAIDKIDGDPSN